MTDKVQKIREEVERMHNLLPIMDGDNISVNYADRICTTLEMYIDSLQEEPKFKIGQTITDPEDSTFTFHINKIEDGKYIESDDAWVLTKDADEEYELVEEPVSEELEEAAIENARFERGDDTEVSYDINRYEGFIDGSNWQKEEDAKIIFNAKEEGYRLGKATMKQQMMKDAVDGEVGEYYPTTIHLDKDIPELKHFDKVKLIIIKED